MNVEATQLLSTVGRDRTIDDWSSRRPTSSSTARNPGTARTTRRTRSWSTARPSTPPSDSCWRCPGGLVARLSLLYGPSRSGREGFFDRTMAALRAGTPQAFFTDEYRTPLDYATAAEILVRLAESETRGMIHVGGPERLSRFELMSRAAAALGIDPTLVRPNRRADVPFAEPRPADVSLDSSRLNRLFPDLNCLQVENALAPL